MAFELPANDRDLISTLDRKISSGLPPLDRAKVNLAYFLGQQWIGLDPASRRLGPAPPDPRKVRITIQKLATHVEWAVARLTKSYPRPEARPVSDDDDDISAAKVANRVLQHEFDRGDLDALLVEAYFWGVICGYSYIQLTWAANLGPVVGQVEAVTGERGMIFRALGTPGPKPGGGTPSILPVHRGDVMADVVPFFELSVDPSARTMPEARWACRMVALSKDEVWERWGKEPTDPPRAIPLFEDMRWAFDPSARAGGSSNSGDWVLVKQFWLRPGSRARRAGMVVTWAGDTVLEAPRDFPYAHARLPFVQVNFLPPLGSREGRTWVGDLVEMQTDYNDARSREAHFRRKIAPKILAPELSIDPKKVTSDVEIITYKPTGAPPTFAIPDSGWVRQFEIAMDRVDREMSQRTSLTGAAQGQVLSGVAAAALIAAQEASDVPGNIPARELARALRDLGHMWLLLVRQYWEEDRVVRTWSEQAGKLEVSRFSRADISGELDLHVSVESALPRSKAARISLVMELHREKIIEDPILALRAVGMDIPGLEPVMRKIDLAARQAERENDALLQGEPRQIQLWHNHAIHLAVHNDLRMTFEYETAPDNVRAVIDAHCANHEALLQGQSLAPGPPGAPGSIPTNGSEPTGPGGGARPPRLQDLMGGIGQPQQPGPVPNTTLDSQGAAMGV